MATQPAPSTVLGTHTVEGVVVTDPTKPSPEEIMWALEQRDMIEKAPKMFKLLKEKYGWPPK